MHFVAPSAAYVSTPQGEQNVAAISSECEPALHFVHKSEPFWALNLPASQAVQVAPLLPLKPALHMQSVRSSLLRGELEFRGQFVQAELPITSL